MMAKAPTAAALKTAQEAIERAEADRAKAAEVLEADAAAKRADAEKARAEKDAAAAARARRIVDEYGTLTADLAARVKAAAAARDEVVEALDLPAILKAEAHYRAHLEARHLLLAEYEGAGYLLGDRPPEKPIPRDRPATLFPHIVGGAVGASDGTIMDAVVKHARAEAADIVESVLEAHGLADA